MYSFSVVGIRLMAAYFVFSGLAFSGEVLLPLLGETTTPQLEYYQSTSFYVLTNLIAGILIWFIAKPLATFVTAGLPDAKKKIETESIIASGTFLIGLYWTISSLPNAIYTTFYINSSYVPGDLSYLNEILFSNWLSGLTGLIVMLGSYRIAWLVGKIRKMGTK